MRRARPAPPVVRLLKRALPLELSDHVVLNFVARILRRQVAEQHVLHRGTERVGQSDKFRHRRPDPAFEGILVNQIEQRS